MSNESQQHPCFALTAQVFRGSAEGEIGSAYLIGPGTFLTALHCAIEGEVVPDGKVTCEVRLFADHPHDVLAAGWKFRPATLVWPPAGVRVDELDLAVLVVAEKDRTAAMSFAQPLTSHFPKRLQRCEAVGYPNWREEQRIEQRAPYRARGLLESDRSLPGVLNDFDVQGATPEDVEQWHGMSGAVLFARNSDAVLGVVSTRGRSKNNTLLGATLLREVVADQGFWRHSGLPKPTHDDATLRRASATNQSAKAIKLRDFLHLFDREAQHRRWRFIVETALTKEPYPTLIVPIVAGLEDEASYLIRRLEGILEKRFPVWTGAYRNTDKIGWVTDDVPVEEAVDQMLHDLKAQLRIEDKVEIRDIQKAGPVLRGAIETGNVPRAFRIELALNEDERRITEVFRDLFKRLDLLGTFDSPIVLFLAFDKNSLPTEARDKPLDHAFIKTISELAKPNASLSWRPLAPLGLCKSTDIDDWGRELESLQNPLLDLTRLSTMKILSEIYSNNQDLFNEPFAFQRARFALEKLDL